MAILRPDSLSNRVDREVDAMKQVEAVIERKEDADLWMKFYRLHKDQLDPVEMADRALAEYKKRFVK